MKVNNLLLLFPILIQLLISCGGGYKLTPNNYYIPEKYKFRLRKKFKLTDTSILSTSSLYQYNCYKDRWFKFYKDGRVLFAFDSNVPKNLSDRIFGYAGFYTLEGDKLKIELTYTQKRNDWYILLLEGKVKDDKIIFYKDHPRGINRNIEHFSIDSMGCNYIKTQEPYLLLPADW